MLVFGQSFEETALEVTNTLQIFMLAQRPIPAVIPRLIAPALLGEPRCIERWKATHEKPQYQGALFETAEAASVPIHWNRSVRRQRIEVQFVVAGAVPAIGSQRQPVRRSRRRALLLFRRQQFTASQSN